MKDFTKYFIPLCCVVWILASCKNNNDNSDADGDGGIGTCNQEAYDKSTGLSTAVDFLQTVEQTHDVGAQVTGYVCPRGDTDFYRVNLQANNKLLNVKLQGTLSDSPVQLTYRISRAETKDGKTTEKIVATAPNWTSGSVRNFDEFHYLAESGEYFIVVFDENNDNRDTNNAYTLSFVAIPDSDKNEPNNDQASAKAPASEGYISFVGDEDWYKVEVPVGDNKNKLLRVILKNNAKTKVDLKYSIYDANHTLIGEDQNDNGALSVTNLETLHALPKPGTYYVVVQDVDNDESDPQVPYTITTEVVNEPDGNELTVGKRNDLPSGATVLGTFSGDTFSQTISGQIASKADVDYYVINGFSGVSDTNPAIVEFSLTMDTGTTGVDPLVLFVYPHKESTCTSDGCCNVLNSAASCQDVHQCLRSSYGCVARGDNFCSLKNDDGTFKCLANPTPSCSISKYCEGASTCLKANAADATGFCGAKQFFRPIATGGKIKSAMPLIHEGPWYIKVGDRGNRKYAYGVNYTLSVKVTMDPDAGQELNNEVFFQDPATAVLESEAKYHKAVASYAYDTLKKPIYIKIDPTTNKSNTVKGYISYEGDQDWYILEHPCKGADCSLRVDWTSTCPAASDFKQLELFFQIRYDNDAASQWFAFPNYAAKEVTPASNMSYGIPNQCLFLYNDYDKERYYLTVSDWGNNFYSTSCSYSFSITKTDGCAAPCQMKYTPARCTNQ